MRLPRKPQRQAAEREAAENAFAENSPTLEPAPEPAATAVEETTEEVTDPPGESALASDTREEVQDADASEPQPALSGSPQAG